MQIKIFYDVFDLLQFEHSKMMLMIKKEGNQKKKNLMALKYFSGEIKYCATCSWQA